MRSSIFLSLVAASFLNTPAYAAVADKRSSTSIPTVDTVSNPTCKPFVAVRDAIMGGLFGGRCVDLTRQAIRLAFHDAGSFSLALKAAGQPNGAADGSFLTDPNEIQRVENFGMAGIVAALTPLPDKFGVPPGDVLHLAGTLAVLACPGGPTVQTFVGRAPPKNITPQGLLPDTHDTAQNLVNRFADMGFSISETMALIGSHTSGTQFFVDPAAANNSFDTTDGIWDVRFYTETQQNITDPGIFHLPSDITFANDPLTAKEFGGFVGHQNKWASAYANAHAKMSLLGQDPNSVTDCTEILPPEIRLQDVTFSGSGGSSGNDPIDPAKLEAAIQATRSIFL